MEAADKLFGSDPTTAAINSPDDVLLGDKDDFSIGDKDEALDALPDAEDDDSDDLSVRRLSTTNAFCGVLIFHVDPLAGR